ncbi:MAG: hypothetical protein O3C49_09720 [Proteobacteria bacterium]|nr:hypothetical protein [Pseudomonadota bacterium]MDA1324481.1 hypothetical protein [Pseudomonadota bacterium]
MVVSFFFFRHCRGKPTGVWDNPFTQPVMVGEGRPSTSFCFSRAVKKQKTTEKRGWSAFADHDEEGEVRPHIVAKNWIAGHGREAHLGPVMTKGGRS